MTSPQTDQQPPLWFTIKDAAAEIGIGYLPTWRRLRRGDFEGVRRAEDGRWLIPLEAVAKVKAGVKRRASAKEV